jgi:transposase
METVPVFVGLDYHSRSVQVCVVDGAGRVLLNRRCGNDPAEVAACVKQGWSVKGVAVESCCGAADFAESLGVLTGWGVVMAHAGYVARMKSNPDKTDYADARMLAELCRAGLIPRVWLPPEAIRELWLLIRLRADLVCQARACKTRILSVLRQQRVVEPGEASKGSGRWTRAWLAWLQSAACAVSEQGRFVITLLLEELASISERLKKLEQRVTEATEGDEVVARLMQQKGIVGGGR